MRKYLSICLVTLLAFAIQPTPSNASTSGIRTGIVVSSNSSGTQVRITMRERHGGDKVVYRANATGCPPDTILRANLSRVVKRAITGWRELDEPDGENFNDLAEYVLQAIRIHLASVCTASTVSMK